MNYINLLLSKLRKEIFPEKYTLSFTEIFDSAYVQNLQFDRLLFERIIFFPLKIQDNDISIRETKINQIFNRPFISPTRIISYKYDVNHHKFIINEESDDKDVIISTEIKTLSDNFKFSIYEQNYTFRFWVEFIIYKYFIIPNIQSNFKKYLS